MSTLGPGTYVLILFLKQHRSIAVGKLGKIGFPPGYYAYVGSAFGPGGLAARLKHHLFSDARPHWHIDYLRRQAKTEQLWLTEFNQPLEHSWASVLEQFSNSAQAFRGFGCSDCKCPSHIFYFPGPPPFKRFRESADKTVESNGRIRQFLLNERRMPCPTDNTIPISFRNSPKDITSSA
jgi:Uri superfamily endonuclease